MSTDIESLHAAVIGKIDTVPKIEGYGWPGQVELALIDAVLSIRARYGDRKTTGVMPRVRAYAATRDEPCDDLRVLAATPRAGLATALDTDQRSGGRPKVDLILEVAAGLASVGVVHAADVDPRDKPQHQAWCTVHGLGPVTWAYFGMLVGRPGVKVDRMISTFVSDAVGHGVNEADATGLVTAVADRIGARVVDLDHAIWTYERDQRRRSTNRA